MTGWSRRISPTDLWELAHELGESGESRQRGRSRRGAFLDPALSSGLNSGSTYELISGRPIHQSIWSWSAQAYPVEYERTGRLSFHIDESGTLRGADVGGAPGRLEMPEFR